MNSKKPDTLPEAPLLVSPLHEKMSVDEINACPIKYYSGPVHLIDTQDKLTPAVNQLQKETLLGFDTETKAAFKKGEHYPPALLQLASKNDVYIFQLVKLKDLSALFNILADQTIIKAGVALNYDLNELNKLKAFTPAGFVDLADLAKKLGIKHSGLRGLCARILEFRITKGAQRSNWGQDNLTRSQITYAATDAWVGLLLYQKFQELLKIDERGRATQRPCPGI